MRLRNVRFIGPLILLAILATSTRFLLLAPNGPVACLASLLSPYPRLVFIDLGANDGDSFKVFLGEDKSLRWSYKFPKPCGARYGDFEAVLVEANPRFDVVLASLKANMSERTPPIRVEIVGRSVVGTKDGPTPFGIDETVRENCNNCGSSARYASWQKANQTDQINPEVTGVDLARFLRDRYTEKDYVLIKMDIEGAEYEVLPHLLETGVYKLIDALVVEYHPWHKGYTDLDRQKAETAAKEMKRTGVLMPEGYFTDA